MRFRLNKVSLILMVFVSSISWDLYNPVIAYGTTTPTECPYGYYSDNDILAYDKCAEALTTCAQSVGVNGTATVPVDFNLGTDPVERRVNFIKAIMTDYGLSAQQAAGIIGNFMHESGGEHLPPDVNEGLRNPPAPQWVVDMNGPNPPRRVTPGVNTGGYGWAQWTGGRKTSFIEFAISNNYMSGWNVHGTDAANYAYLKEELNNGYSSTITELKKQTSPEDAAVSFEDTFENAGVPALVPRNANARQAFEEYSFSPSGGSTVGTNCVNNGGGAAAIVGDAAFPLLGNKSVVNNPEMFRNNTADLGGHPYTAYDILADPGIPVAAFLSGTVTRVTTDRCPGRMISIYNQESNLTISYLHLNMSGHVAEGDTLNVGDRVGVVGTDANGCGISHLHIDAVQGRVRVGCSRLNCSDANKALFRDIGPQLYQTFQVLPD